ncbi:MAG: ankyrin repeat domain-containing protein [Rickettsiales bacterium]|jgi:hypothetical protein|nr:ankyrin repeat domain-containing protein [Rickettsiales bacterium]
MVSFGPRENIISNFLWGSDSWEGKKIDKAIVKKEIDSYKVDDLRDGRRMHFMLRDAVEAGNEEIVKYLLDKGACPIVIYNNMEDTIRGEYAITDVFAEDGSLSRKLGRELESRIFKKTLETVEKAIGEIRESQKSMNSDKEIADNMFGKLNENLLEKLETYKKKVSSRLKS